MKKRLKNLIALSLSVLIALGGVGVSYIDGYCAGNDGYRFKDKVWNYDDSIFENFWQQTLFVANYLGSYIDPTLKPEEGSSARNDLIDNFLNYANSDRQEADKLTEEDIPAYFEENVKCNHGGGGLSFSNEVLDALHYTVSTYLDSKSGYVLLPTATPDMVSPAIFTLKTDYERFVQNINALGLVFTNIDIRNPATTVEAAFHTANGDKVKVCGYYCKDILKILNHKTPYDPILRFIREDWSYDRKCRYYYSFKLAPDAGKSYSSLDDFLNDSDISYTTSADFKISSDAQYDYWYIGYSPDGRYVKVWYDLQAYKNSDIGKPVYYASKQWVNYDYSVDNSVTISDSYITNNTNNGTVNNNYGTIQNIVNESNSDGSLTEGEIYDIVQKAIEDLNKGNGTGGGDSGNTGGDSGNTGGDSGNTGGDSNNGSGGSGVGSIIDGVGSLLDTILTIIGKLLGLLSGFVESVLALFEGFTIFTDGFSGFLSATFGFIPAEAINVIVSGITLMVILAVIKFMK